MIFPAAGLLPGIRHKSLSNYKFLKLPLTTHLSMMSMTVMLPTMPPTMQRMYTHRFSRSSGTVDQGSAIDSGVSLPTENTNNS